jgi:hypothetical protein
VVGLSNHPFANNGIHVGQPRRLQRRSTGEGWLRFVGCTVGNDHRKLHDASAESKKRGAAPTMAKGIPARKARFRDNWHLATPNVSGNNWSSITTF